MLGHRHLILFIYTKCLQHNTVNEYSVTYIEKFIQYKKNFRWKKKYSEIHCCIGSYNNYYFVFSVLNVVCLWSKSVLCVNSMKGFVYEQKLNLFRDCIKIGANKLFFIQIKNCFTHTQNAKLVIFFTMNIELRCTLSYNDHIVDWPLSCIFGL